MMTAKFRPTEKQIEKWSKITIPSMPSDDEFKTIWKKSHHGKVTGWGMGKCDWVAQHSDDHLTCTIEYNLGIWQGRVDAAREDPQADTPNYHTSPFEYGYYQGYSTFKSFWNGYDKNAREKFLAEYGN